MHGLQGCRHLWAGLDFSRQRKPQADWVALAVVLPNVASTSLWAAPRGIPSNGLDASVRRLSDFVARTALVLVAQERFAFSGALPRCLVLPFRRPRVSFSGIRG